MLLKVFEALENSEHARILRYAGSETDFRGAEHELGRLRVHTDATLLKSRRCDDLVFFLFLPAKNEALSHDELYTVYVEQFAAC